MNKRITLAHGNGGRLTRQIIDAIFYPAFGAQLDTRLDAASMTIPSEDMEWLITTDSFTVDPLVFPGGDIGSLAVHGTVNDLAVAGAQPRFMTLNVIMEEGLDMDLLKQIALSIGETARHSGISILAGDTKVVRRGQGGGLYLATTGVGQRPRSQNNLSCQHIVPGDRLLASGTLGDHGAAIMLAREQFGLSGTLRSDAASVLPVTQCLLRQASLRFMRDPTRGGLASVAHDVARGCGYAVRLWENRLPVAPTVRSVCDMLGYEPLHLASEGRVIAVLSEEAAAEAVKALHDTGYTEAAVIGEVTDQAGSDVILSTLLGGERRLAELEDDPLPRIC